MKEPGQHLEQNGVLQADNHISHKIKNIQDVGIVEHQKVGKQGREMTTQNS